MHLRSWTAPAAAALLLAGCASMGEGANAAAPQPAKPVDAASFYTGVWHEIARNPMTITNGCVAGVAKKDGSSHILNPPGDYLIQADEELLILAEDDNIVFQKYHGPLRMDQGQKV